MGLVGHQLEGFGRYEDTDGDSHGREARSQSSAVLRDDFTAQGEDAGGADGAAAQVAGQAGK